MMTTFELGCGGTVVEPIGYQLHFLERRLVVVLWIGCFARRRYYFRHRFRRKKQRLHC